MVDRSIPRSYLVRDATEEHGFAQLIEDGTGRLLHCELFVRDPSTGDALRLRPGDRLVGTAHGERIAPSALVEPAPPPNEIVAQMARLIRSLENYQLVIDRSAESLAAQEWRRDRRQVRGELPALARLVYRQLTFLFGRKAEAHPFDDRTLVPRLVRATQRYLPDLEVVEQRDENDDVQHFRVAPGDAVIPLGVGDWEQPQGCYAPLIEAINRRLALANAPDRWVAAAQDWIFTTPGLVSFLSAHGLLTTS